MLRYVESGSRGGRAGLFTLGWLSVFFCSHRAAREFPATAFYFLLLHTPYSSKHLGHEQFADHGDLAATQLTHTTEYSIQSMEITLFFVPYNVKEIYS